MFTAPAGSLVCFSDDAQRQARRSGLIGGTSRLLPNLAFLLFLLCVFYADIFDDFGPSTSTTFIWRLMIYANVLTLFRPATDDNFGRPGCAAAAC